MRFVRLKKNNNNNPDIDFLFTEQLPLKGQRGSRGKPWMAAWLPRRLLVSLQPLISETIFSSAWVNHYWTVKQGCCCCRDRSRSCFESLQSTRLSERMTSQTLSQRGRRSWRTPGGKACTNMITHATCLNPGIRIQSVLVGVMITRRALTCTFLLLDFSRDWSDVKYSSLEHGNSLQKYFR